MFLFATRRTQANKRLTAQQPFFWALGLVVDLFQHEMVEASLAEFGDVEVYGLDVIIA